MDTILTLAERLARTAHAGHTEFRTGHDYMTHVLRVVALVDSDDEKAVAWLHDVLEDSPLTAADLLAAGVPAPLVDAVVLLTRFDLTVPYAAYIDSVKASGNALAMAVKLADLKDHLRADGHCPATHRPKYEAAWTALTGVSW